MEEKSSKTFWLGIFASWIIVIIFNAVLWSKYHLARYMEAFPFVIIVFYLGFYLCLMRQAEGSSRKQVITAILMWCFPIAEIIGYLFLTPLPPVEDGLFWFSSQIGITAFWLNIEWSISQIVSLFDFESLKK